MSITIPLVTRIDAGVAESWRAALSAALPDHRIVPFGQLAAADRARAKLAIVANPDPAELRQLPALVWVQSLWAGIERMVAELPPDGLHIVRLVDPALADTMAEAVLAWTLYLHRDMPSYRIQQAKGAWRQLPMRLAEETPVGILGMGALGRAAAARLRAQGFPILGWSRRPSDAEGVLSHQGEDGLKAVLAAARILVVLLPLTDATRGLLSDDRLAQAAPGAALINFARGPIVDVPALCRYLDSGRLSHAVLDVFNVEPLPEEDPLWRHPKVTVLPHVAAPTNFATASRIAARNIGVFLADGTLPLRIDRTGGY